MTEDKLKVMYSEMYEYLNLLGEKYINKIPKGLYDFIEREKYEKYSLDLDFEQDISKQITEETLLFIMYLNLMYWTSKEEKEELIKTYKENDIEQEKRLKELYNTDHLFRKKNVYLNNEQQKNEQSLIVVKRDNVLIRIIKRIKEIFRKNNR